MATETDRQHQDAMNLVDELMAIGKAFMNVQIGVGSSTCSDARQALLNSLIQIKNSEIDTYQMRWIHISYNKALNKNDLSVAIEEFINDEKTAVFPVLRPYYVQCTQTLAASMDTHGYNAMLSVMCLMDGYKQDTDPQNGLALSAASEDLSVECIEKLVGGLIEEAGLANDESKGDLKPESGAVLVVSSDAPMDFVKGAELAMQKRNVRIRMAGSKCQHMGIGSYKRRTKGMEIFRDLEKETVINDGFEYQGKSCSRGKDKFEFFTKGVVCTLLRTSVRINTDYMQCHEKVDNLPEIWARIDPANPTQLKEYCTSTLDVAVFRKKYKKAEDLEKDHQVSEENITKVASTWMLATSGQELPYGDMSLPPEERTKTVLRHTILYPIGYKLADTGDVARDYAPLHILLFSDEDGITTACAPMPYAGTETARLRMLKLERGGIYKGIKAFTEKLNTTNYELLPHGVGNAGAFGSYCLGLRMHMKEGSVGQLADGLGEYKAHGKTACGFDKVPFVITYQEGEVGYNDTTCKNFFGNLMLGGFLITRTPNIMPHRRFGIDRKTTSIMSWNEGEEWAPEEMVCHFTSTREQEKRKRFLYAIVSSKLKKLPKKDVLSFIFGATYKRANWNVSVKILYKAVLYSQNPVDQALSVASVLLWKEGDSHSHLDQRNFCGHWGKIFGDMAVDLLTTWEELFDTETAGEWGLNQVERGIDRGASEEYDERVLAHPAVSHVLQKSWTKKTGLITPRFKFFSDMFAYVIFLGLLSLREFTRENHIGYTAMLLYWTISLVADDLLSASLRWNSTFATMDFILATGYFIAFVLEAQDSASLTTDLLKAAMYIVAWARFIKYLIVNESFGPVWVMIRLVIMELIRLGAIIMIFFVGVVVALHAANQSEENAEVQAMFGTIGLTIISVFMYATSGFDSVDFEWWDSLGVYIFSQAVLILFTLMVAILLLNLFIAMLTSTYERIQSIRDRQWLVLFAFTAIEYEQKGPFPAPLNIFNLIYRKTRLEKKKQVDEDETQKMLRARQSKAVSRYERSIRYKQFMASQNSMGSLGQLYS
eukprot:m.80289 g.80289  ORF g.80289 m.80289 type:complete len:1054 (-) comp12750_c0_seq2:1589-4750(-)